MKCKIDDENECKPGRPHKCCICKKTFKQLKYLKKHMNKAHPFNDYEEEDTENIEVPLGMFWKALIY